jgi:hypothetical protein
MAAVHIDCTKPAIEVFPLRLTVVATVHFAM